MKTKNGTYFLSNKFPESFSSDKKVVGIVEPRVVVRLPLHKVKDSNQLDHIAEVKTTQLIRELPQTFREALLEKGASDLIQMTSTEKFRTKTNENEFVSEESESDFESEQQQQQHQQQQQQHLGDQISQQRRARRCGGGRRLEGERGGVVAVAASSRSERRNLIRKQPLTLGPELNTIDCSRKKCFENAKSGSKNTYNAFNSAQTDDKFTHLTSSGRSCCGQSKHDRLMGSPSTQVTSNPIKSRHIHSPCEDGHYNGDSSEDEKRRENLLSNAEDDVTSQRRRKRKKNFDSQRETEGDNKCCCGNSIRMCHTSSFEGKKLERYETGNDVTNQDNNRPSDQNSDIDDEHFTCSGLPSRGNKRQKKFEETVLTTTTTITEHHQTEFKVESIKNNIDDNREDANSTLAEGMKRRMGGEVNVLNGKEGIIISSTFKSNCLEVFGKKNNLETKDEEEEDEIRLRRYSESSTTTYNDDEPSEDDEDDSPEIENPSRLNNNSSNINISNNKTSFKHSKIDDKWLYCRERGCAFWTRKPERMIRHATCHVAENKHYQCPDCPLRFYSLAKMLKHDRKVHTGVKDYECRVCDAEVTDIQIHMRVHKAEKQFECPACPLQFRHKNSLVRHLCQHTGERPYRCTDCDSAFISMHRLKEHTKKSHGSEKVFKEEMKMDFEDQIVVKSERKKVGKKVRQIKEEVGVGQPVSTVKDNAANSCGTVLPTATILTGLPTNIPLLVQAANGQVYLLSTPNIQSTPMTSSGGHIFLPSNSSIDFLPSNQTLFFPAQQQQQQFQQQQLQQQQQQQQQFQQAPTNFFQMQPTLASESLVNSALQAAASASAIAANAALNQNVKVSNRETIQQEDKQQQQQQQQQQLRRQKSLSLMQQQQQHNNEHQIHSSPVNSIGTSSTFNTDKLSQKRARLVGETVSPFISEDNKSPLSHVGSENGIKKVNTLTSANIDPRGCQITSSSLIRGCNKDRGVRPPQDPTSYGRCVVVVENAKRKRRNDIVRAAMLESEIA